MEPRKKHLDFRAEANSFVSEVHGRLPGQMHRDRQGHPQRYCLSRFSSHLVEKFRRSGTLFFIRAYWSAAGWWPRPRQRMFSMYHHVKKLMYTVRVDEPDPTFGNMLLEQFGGANGELAAAMQYSIQGLNCDDPGRKDLLMDIGTEELSHLEIVGTLARLHLKPLKSVREEAEIDPLIAIAGGGGVNLYNSMGNAWTADYLKDHRRARRRLAQ